MHSIEILIQELQEGKMIILMDSPARENEADIVMAAEKVTPEHINFMITHAKGLICLPMSKKRCEQLQLDLQPRRACSPCAPKFTVSIEAASGVTTGVSVDDRAHTIRLAADENIGADAIATPGHIFPIMAEPEGVLAREGHTEGSIDLMRLAGLSQVAIVCEITRPDGKMSRLPDVEQFAKEHHLKVGFMEDLIKFRQAEDAAHSAEGEK